jgi:hypothetical protein
VEAAVSCVQDAVNADFAFHSCYCNKDNCNDVTKCDCATTRSASVAKNKEYAEAEDEAARVEAAKVETEKAAAAKLEAEKSGAQTVKAAVTAAAVSAVT